MAAMQLAAHRRHPNLHLGFYILHQTMSMTFFDVIQGEEKYVQKQARDLGGKQCQITITQVMSAPRRTECQPLTSRPSGSQYSSANMMVSTRAVTVGSAASGECWAKSKS